MKNLKKSQYFILGLAFFAFFSLNTLAQAPQKFKSSPSVVKQGGEVKIVYQPDQTDQPVTGVVYLFKDYKWEGHDLPLTKTDTGYVANYKIPEGTSLMCYRFWLGESVDAGARFPYGFVVHDKTGKKIAPGGYTEWGMLRFKGADGRMMPLVSKAAEIEPRTLVQLWISKDFGDINIARHLFYDMARGIKSYPAATKADSVIRRKGDEILNLPDVDEREMISVERTYSNTLHKDASADSVKALILAKFPGGLRSRLLAMDSIYFQRNPEIRLKKLEAFMVQYPFNKYPYEDYMNPAIGNRSFFYNTYTGIITYLFSQKRYADMKRLIEDGPYQMLDYFFTHFVDYPFRATTPMITTAQQLEFSTFIINNMMLRAREKESTISGRDYFGPLEWKKVVIADNRWSISYYAGLLYNSGNYAGAMKYAEMVKSLIGYSDFKFATLYAKLLDHYHKNAEAEKFMEASIQSDAVTPELIALLKTYYVKKHKSDNGFEVYYNSLVPAKHTEEMHARLRKSLIHVPAINFKLMNLKGEEVDLSKQKGKIVVLDFWASWCFPCKAAMPGMETLVQKYKADQNVQFYFISTMEESPDYKKLVTDFISNKKYDFNVLYDGEDPQTKKMGIAFNSYAKLLHLSGIPQKVIIDGNGFVRWKADGFDGDLIKLTNEVNYVISLIQQEKPQ